MSHYFLDEIPTAALQGEISLRAQRRDRGVCDYCERHLDAPSCRFPERHKLARNRIIIGEVIPDTIGTEAHTLLAEASNHGMGNTGLQKRIMELLKEIVRKWD